MPKYAIGLHIELKQKRLKSSGILELYYYLCGTTEYFRLLRSSEKLPPTMNRNSQCYIYLTDNCAYYLSLSLIFQPICSWLFEVISLIFDAPFFFLEREGFSSEWYYFLLFLLNWVIQKNNRFSHYETLTMALQVIVLGYLNLSSCDVSLAIHLVSANLDMALKSLSDR